MEETGLVVQEFFGEFDEMVVGMMSVQLDYVVTVKPEMEIKVNPDEHSEWMWTREEEIADLSMTIEMNTCVTRSGEQRST